MQPSTNSFEGAKTLRVYNLLKYGQVWEQIPVHPNVLPIVEAVLDPGCLVSSLSSINIGAGETAQPIHADDQLIPIPKPHPPTVCNSMWAITDFTEANGATRLMPGTHLLDHSPNYGQAYDSIPAEMAQGLGARVARVAVARRWRQHHRRRPDRHRDELLRRATSASRRTSSSGCRRRSCRTFEPRLQQLVGYGIYTGLIGHIDKQSPAKALFGEGGDQMLWDAIG